jgi:hypothetical protein
VYVDAEKAVEITIIGADVVKGFDLSVGALSE